MHMIAYKDIRPKARALVSIPLAQDSAPELTSVELSDFHCPAPDCSCTQNYLRISRFTRLRDSDPSDWRRRTAEVRLQVDHRSGEVLEVSGGPLGEWISDYLKQDRKWLAKLRKRVAEVAEWKRPDGWKSKDWSELEDASMISYHRIRPTEPTIVFEEDGREHFCADWYCWNPACDCTEMLLFMIDSDGDLLGIVRIDRPSRRVLKVEKASIPEARLSALTDRFMKKHPEIFKIFSQRAQFMAQEFGAHVRPQALPVRPSAKVGRNDPCPCGSGKKHKKCCLR